MYDLHDYLAMVEDEPRTRAYLDAMRAVIRPGDVVLELGTGFGFFAVHAARLGASRVFALEPADAIAHGPALAEANGVADRITFMQQVSTRFTPPVRADVLVEDLRGTSPLHQGRLAALLDARERLLRPGARVVPARDRLLVAPAPAPGADAPDVANAPAGDRLHGIDIATVRALVPAAWRRIRPDQVHPLAAGRAWTAIDYARFTSPDADGSASFTIERDGTIAGLASWFETDLVDAPPAIGYGTGPGTPRSVYDLGWFPLADPIPARAGDALDVRLRAKFDGVDYVWAWDVEWRAGDGRAALVTRRQSNLLQRALSPARRDRRAGTHVPALGDEGRLLRDALTLADGSRTLDAIAEALRARHPAILRDAGAARRWVGERLGAIEDAG